MDSSKSQQPGGKPLSNEPKEPRKKKNRAGRFVQAKRKWAKINQNTAFMKEINRRHIDFLSNGLKPSDFGNILYTNNYVLILLYFV